MKKKRFKVLATLVLSLVLICGFSMPVMAATSYKDVKTDGGSSGKVTIRFRCTCGQDSIPTNFSWSSSITPPADIILTLYTQVIAITRPDHTQFKATVLAPSFSHTFQEAILGGRASMSAGSTAFGKASAEISVTR